MARQKITAEPILQTYNAVDDAIREWTELDSQVAAIAQQQQEKIDQIKEKFEIQAQPVISRKLRLEKDLQDFGEFHKSDFDKQRSRKLTFGKIGFRISSELKYLSGWTAKKVVAKLKELGRVEFIKKTESVKRSDIKQAELDSKIMAMFGCKIAEKDDFYFEPDGDAIANAKKKLELVGKKAAKAA